MSEEQFRSSLDRGFFLEWAEVHGKLYGTPIAAIRQCLDSGHSPVLDVDVQGGKSVKDAANVNERLISVDISKGIMFSL